MNLLQPIHLLTVSVVVLALIGREQVPELIRGIKQGVEELRNDLSGR